MSTQQNSANNENNPVPITKAKFNELCRRKHIREEEEWKWCKVEEAEKHRVEVEEAKRQAEAEAWVKAAEEVECKWKEAKAQKKCQQVEYQEENGVHEVC
ncbi:hypothetical protein ID866_11814 [Astraeus odoratus]|nr:hypothetical protein ID866_11814 [Astraeus odoratus]